MGSSLHLQVFCSDDPIMLGTENVMKGLIRECP